MSVNQFPSILFRLRTFFKYKFYTRLKKLLCEKIYLFLIIFLMTNSHVILRFYLLSKCLLILAEKCYATVAKKEYELILVCLSMKFIRRKKSRRFENDNRDSFFH